jgi:hypothetical protein
MSEISSHKKAYMESNRKHSFVQYHQILTYSTISVGFSAFFYYRLQREKVLLVFSTKLCIFLHAEKLIQYCSL